MNLEENERNINQSNVTNNESLEDRLIVNLDIPNQPNQPIVNQIEEEDKEGQNIFENEIWKPALH